MDRKHSVEDIVGGLWKLGRTDSEQQFQDFLSRIPSSSLMPNEYGGQDAPYGNVEGGSGGLNRVASIDFLRRLIMTGSSSPVGNMPPPPMQTPHTQMETIQGQVANSMPLQPTSGKSSGDDTNAKSGDSQPNTANDVRKARRMLSNRESARRSRRRKQEHLGNLESQIAALNKTNSELQEKLLETEEMLKKATEEARKYREEVAALKEGNGGSSRKVERSDSMQKIASAEHLHKKMHHSGAAEGGCSPKSVPNNSALHSQSRMGTAHTASAQ
mmetsp:Transcript_10692/g.65928  ORF Transcript_10692/g.65928 Transcript_10692/m.65928 type:complete len:272 (-) Transcript_10692:1695-2510(-)